VYTEFWWGYLRDRGHLEDKGIDNINMDLQELGCRGMDWIDLERWRTLVNAVMNLQIP